MPVFPVVAYGITPYFRAFPGTITLRIETFLNLVRDILDGIAFAAAELPAPEEGAAPPGAFTCC